MIGGAADELSRAHWITELARTCPAPSSLTSYADARHSMTETTATALRPPWRGLTVDWLHDRILGRDVKDSHHLVAANGGPVELLHPHESI